MFTRYAAAFASTARLREGARAGFLVPARLAYLAFGLLPGFFVTRYVFALISIVPAYLLLRRLYGIPAGAIAVIVLLSCPVIITAWGTDYPDSAVVSYVVGAVACLAMPSRDRWRPAWLALASLLLTLAVWSHGVGALLVGATGVSYAAVRLLRERKHLLRDGALALAVAVVSTLLLMVGSRLVLGQFDFIRPTLNAAAYLNQPSQIPLAHSSNRDWALYVAYVLVPPAVIAAFAATFSRRLSSISTPKLLVGVVCASQFVLFACLQFLGQIQTLEMRYFSSTIWGVVCLALAVTLAELALPLSGHRLGRWLPPALLVAVPLAYEADPHVPAFGWAWTGAVLAFVPAVIALAMRLANRPQPAHAATSRRPAVLARRIRIALGIPAAVVGITGSLLVLTVAPSPAHKPLPGLAGFGDPPSDYAGALGDRAAGNLAIDWYEVSTDLPRFVGNATYQGEQLLMWYPWTQIKLLIEPTGIYHAAFDSLQPGFPQLTAEDQQKLFNRRPAELLLMSTTGAQFLTAFHALGAYRPVLLRTTVIRHGSAVLHAWLILLRW
jgi:4-amino-4-deoxy-L-arabinose transferase-like glycosyltransferase